MVAFPLLKLNEWSFLLTTSGWIKVVAYEFIDELQYDECEECIQKYETRKLAQSVEIVQDLAFIITITVIVVIKKCPLPMHQTM